MTPADDLKNAWHVEVHSCSDDSCCFSMGCISLHLPESFHWRYRRRIKDKVFWGRSPWNRFNLQVVFCSDLCWFRRTRRDCIPHSVLSTKLTFSFLQNLNISVTTTFPGMKNFACSVKSGVSSLYIDKHEFGFPCFSYTPCSFVIISFHVKQITRNIPGNPFELI